jgi:recombinational DNA repair ATPase RecF
VEESGNTSPVYLVDDLLAELDASHAKAVCGRLAASGAQVLITAVDLEPLQQWWASPGRVFHVEQGNIIGSAG